MPPAEITDELPPEYLYPRWYAVYTRSRHEKRITDQLERKTVGTFLPVYEAVHRWKNGRHRVTMPLFPGYTFAHIALKNRLEVLKVPGVVRLVGFNGMPTPVADEDVEGLQRALAAGVRAEPHPYLTVGRRVRIMAGPLAGHEGILLRRKGSVRVVLSIHLIQRSIVVEANAAGLMPVSNSP